MLEWTYVAPEGSSKSVVDMLHIIAEVYAGIKDKMVDIVIPNRPKSSCSCLERMDVPFVSLNTSDNSFCSPDSRRFPLHVYLLF